MSLGRALAALACALGGAALLGLYLARPGAIEAAWPAHPTLILYVWAVAALLLPLLALRGALPPGGRGLRRVGLLLALLGAGLAAGGRASGAIEGGTGFVNPPLDGAEIAGAGVRLVAVEPDAGAADTRVRVRLEVVRGAATAARMAPEFRTAISPGGETTSEPARAYAGMASLIARLRPAGGERVLVTITALPLGRLVPLGLGIGVAGGVLLAAGLAWPLSGRRAAAAGGALALALGSALALDALRPEAAAPPGPAPAQPVFERAGRHLDHRGDGGAWLTMADALMRGGDTADAVSALSTATAKEPARAELWIGLGNALALHARGLPPAAEIAYARAQAAALASPLPPYFRGLAARSAGDGAAAQAAFAEAAARAVPGTEIAADIAQAAGPR